MPAPILEKAPPTLWPRQAVADRWFGGRLEDVEYLINCRLIPLRNGLCDTRVFLQEAVTPAMTTAFLTRARKTREAAAPPAPTKLGSSYASFEVLAPKYGGVSVETLTEEVNDNPMLKAAVVIDGEMKPHLPWYLVSKYLTGDVISRMRVKDHNRRMVNEFQARNAAKQAEQAAKEQAELEAERPREMTWEQKKELERGRELIRGRREGK